METQKRALVTGGSGFIGSELIRRLCSEGVHVKALMRRTSSTANLRGVDFEVAVGDLHDGEALQRAVKDVDVVFHLAGIVATPNKQDFLLHNGIGTENVGRACVVANPKLKRFIYVSSLAAAGPAESVQPVTEQVQPRPVSLYGESKLEGERRLTALNAPFPIVVLRPPVVYGPRDRGVLEFVKMVKSGLVLNLPGSTTGGMGKEYSLVHVDDLVDAIVLAGFGASIEKSEVYFISGDDRCSWNEMMDNMATNLQKAPMRVSLPTPVWAGIAGFFTVMGKLSGKAFPMSLDKLKELKADRWICSNEKAKAELGFRPKWDVQTGLKQTLEWYKQNQWI